MKKSRSSTSSDSESGKRCHRGHWKPAEDEKLQQLVEQHGPQNWNFIADHLEGRSGNMVSELCFIFSKIVCNSVMSINSYLSPLNGLFELRRKRGEVEENEVEIFLANSTVSSFSLFPLIQMGPKGLSIFL